MLKLITRPIPKLQNRHALPNPVNIRAVQQNRATSAHNKRNKIMDQLPRLDAITRLSPRVIRILGGNPGKFTLQGTNTYLIGTGSNRILLDTAEGRPAWKESLAKVLKEEKCSVKDVVLTHWHHDHVGGIDDVKELAGDVKVWKNQRYEMEETEDYDDGEVFSVEGATIKAVYSPGHTIDHMAFYFEEEDALFSGDNVLGHGTAVFEDLGTYIDSLEKMKKLFKGRAYPGHGEVIEDGKAKIEEYIQHRRQREVEAVETLRGKGQEGMTSMEMVKVIYAKYPEHLHGPAEGSLLHVLRKLEEEGKVRKGEDGKWRLTEKAAL